MENFDDVIAGMDLDLPEEESQNRLLFVGSVINVIDAGVCALILKDEQSADRFAIWTASLSGLQDKPAITILTLTLNAFAVLVIDYVELITTDTIPSIAAITAEFINNHTVYRNCRDISVETFWYQYTTSTMESLQRTGMLGREFGELIQIFWESSDATSKNLLIVETTSLVYQVIRTIQENFYAEHSLDEVWNHFLTNFRIKHSEVI